MRVAQLGDEASKQKLAQALLRAQDRVSRLHLEQLAAERENALLQARVDLLEGSAAFRMGSALIGALKSPRRLLALPGALRQLARDVRSRTIAARDADESAGAVAFPEQPESALVRAAVGERRAAPQQLADLRIAAVIDEFTRAFLSPDCRLIDIPPVEFEADLDEFRPHLLFVESAWRGRGGSWRQKVHPLSSNLQYLVDCCRRRGIPTVFWNKEDPSHFGNFLDAARLFDFVFTTDVDCVARYRQALGHDRVHVLSFGCQPRIHNPIEHGTRRAAASFAGSWYERYKERSRDFESLVDSVAEVMPVDIYDRNADRGDPNFKFPERFAMRIRGGLPYEQIDTAYKGYRFGITLNTIKTSPSMFARRVYELLASNTIVISNPALGLSKAFGDLVLSDDSPDFVDRLQDLHDSAGSRHRLRLRGLRAVLGSHTAAHRLAEVASLVLGQPYEITGPAVAVLARARSPEQAKALVATYRKQLWANKRLYLVIPALGAEYEVPAPDAGVQLVTEAQARDLRVDSSWDADFIAIFHGDDHYGSHYLVDLALAACYAPLQSVGKGRLFLTNPAGSVQLDEGHCYRESALWLRSSLMPLDAFDGTVLDRLDQMEQEVRPTLSGLAIDEFSYCRGGAGHDMTFVDGHQVMLVQPEPGHETNIRQGSSSATQEE